MNGKLSPEQLEKYVLSHTSNTRTEVARSAKLGGDTAVIKANGFIHMTTDPITASGSNCGKLAVNICANDLAASGVRPLAILLTILAPNSATLTDIENIMIDCEKQCKILNMDIVGGHTEFTDAVTKMVISATAIGLSDKFEEKKKINLGDHIILTKHLGLEGTGILANDYASSLKLANDDFKKANECLNDISVVKEGLLCSEFSTSMHDITEGGVVGALYELLEGENLGAEINLDNAPFLDITNNICDQLSVNKFKMLSSGSMLITTSRSEQITAVLKENNILATDIGIITQSSRLVTLNGQVINIKKLIDED